jgi:hypothetical protein
MAAKILRDSSLVLVNCLKVIVDSKDAQGLQLRELQLTSTDQLNTSSINSVTPSKAVKTVVDTERRMGWRQFAQPNLI